MHPRPPQAGKGSKGRGFLSTQLRRCLISLWLARLRRRAQGDGGSGDDGGDDDGDDDDDDDDERKSVSHTPTGSADFIWGLFGFSFGLRFGFELNSTWEDLALCYAMPQTEKRRNRDTRHVLP